METIKPLLESHFIPILENLERERKSIIDRNYTLMCISGGIMGVGVMIADEMQLIHPFLISVVFGLALYFIFANKGEDGWQLNYKDKVVNTIVKVAFGETGGYASGYGHSQAEFVNTQLFNTTPNRYHSEDMIRGEVGKTFIYFSEVLAEKETKNGKNTSVETLFEGILFTADFNKHFKGKTIVREHGFFDFFSSGKIELENPNFRELFTVIADDPIEARYILTPSFMERILHLHEKWDGDIGLSFIESKLTIAIPMSHNFFEVSIWKKIDPKTQWIKEWNIVSELIEIVHDLDLNTRIWTKE
jgi:Protein of unknown function (DUF3137)